MALLDEPLSIVHCKSRAAPSGRSNARPKSVQIKSWIRQKALAGGKCCAPRGSWFGYIRMRLGGYGTSRNKFAWPRKQVHVQGRPGRYLNRATERRWLGAHNFFAKLWRESEAVSQTRLASGDCASCLYSMWPRGALLAAESMRSNVERVISAPAHCGEAEAGWQVRARATP